mmetsp:Transcript_3356/g.9367  ORF Transcript_3356/g.9367 Transcript_3356/m.9367 type:complete len:225 (-) Transcript_3356:129-803(-)
MYARRAGLKRARRQRSMGGLKKLKSSWPVNGSMLDARYIAWLSNLTPLYATPSSRLRLSPSRTTAPAGTTTLAPSLRCCWSPGSPPSASPGGSRGVLTAEPPFATNVAAATAAAMSMPSASGSSASCWRSASSVRRQANQRCTCCPRSRQYCPLHASCHPGGRLSPPGPSRPSPSRLTKSSQSSASMIGLRIVALAGRWSADERLCTSVVTLSSSRAASSFSLR